MTTGPGAGEHPSGPPRARELSGRELARELRAETAARAAALAADGPPPRVAVVTATDDAGSAAYVRSLASAASRAGIACDVARTTTVAGVRASLAQLADDPEVHGIIVPTPLPDGASLAALAAAIPPAKDVDGASPESIGRLTAGLRPSPRRPLRRCWRCSTTSGWSCGANR